MARKAKRITLDALAERLDMSTPGVQKWLDGTRQPSVDDVNRMAHALNVLPAWLTHGLEPEDMLDGLQGKARDVLRALIMAERSAPLPDALWASIEATLRLARCQSTTTAPNQPAPGIQNLLDVKPAVSTSDFAPSPTSRVK